jgi:ABC-type amino acid transport substrate-binding protein
MVITGVVAAAAAIGYFYFKRSDLRNGTYRIGWMISPPFQVRGPDGRASGISVDLVNLAARRRGIRLEWVFWDNSS